ncbi:MAG: uroporphyrinogen-III C-methyltransferase [Planctomycetota bacterium]|nr:uroporphyrinogen-III C-methyltransferase [Planctomycetota bacterium]
MPDILVGKVYLVGAGPGEPKLLTLRAVEVLGIADVVLFDGLANLDLQNFLRTRISKENTKLFNLNLNTVKSSSAATEAIPGTVTAPKVESSPGECEWISVGKHGSQRIWKQSEINDAIVHHAKLGKTVVRLKGGDTGIFARTGEELERIVSESIPFEVVPGITAASAVAAYAGIPITHRDWASAVALVTGHSQPSDGGPESDEAFDWDSIAAFPGTVVIYMGVTTVEDWSRRLILAGKSPETPVALVRRCSWPDQETTLCTLGEATDRMTPASKFRPPVLVVIGPVAHLGAPFNWFQKRPLFGKKILLCRPQDDSDGTAEELEALGATVYSQPALRVELPENWLELDYEIERLSQYQWVIFSSRFGVRALLDRIHSLGKDLRVLGNCRLAGVGPSIREELEKYQLRADMIAGSPFGAKALLHELLGITGGLTEKSADSRIRFLIVGNNRTDPFLGLELESGGFQVSTITAYRTLAVPYPAPLINEKLKAGSIDYCLATSPAIARRLVDWFGKELSKTKIASISPAVTAMFEGLELSNIVEAKEASIAGIVASIHNDCGLELDKTGDAS